MVNKSAYQTIVDEHLAVASVLRAMEQLLLMGPRKEPERFFDVLRAMLFYLDEYPERLHHPKESDLLFPRLARAVPELMPVIRLLEDDHMQGEARVRSLQHLLLAWELLGDGRREAFLSAARAYITFYLEHMRREEVELLPVARKALTPAQWAEIDEGFRRYAMPGVGEGDACFDRLFTRIVWKTPAPIGVGPE